MSADEQRVPQWAETEVLRYPYLTNPSLHSFLTLSSQIWEVPSAHLLATIESQKAIKNMRYYGNFGLMAFVEQASTHLRHMMHSG